MTLDSAKLCHKALQSQYCDCSSILSLHVLKEAFVKERVTVFPGSSEVFNGIDGLQNLTELALASLRREISRRHLSLECKLL